MYRTGILVLSDKGFRGEREDLSSPEIKRLLGDNYDIQYYEILPDELDIIADKLIYLADELKLDLVLTSGGTGFSARDITPEATNAVITRPTPGIAEAIRLYGLNKTPKAMLS
ncbi:MAG: MogA/MoaB family molybdenum cofactor biosynthesis protein, partial [Syntrophomonadaceae bacterium]|nr:MogA/MoaB family molybdenum cofactor biosynthesis protein [Syntrophomonadaceae bacterium]